MQNSAVNFFNNILLYKHLKAYTRMVCCMRWV